MDLQRTFNGVVAHLFERDDVMFEAIAKEFNLEIENVRKSAYTATEKTKYKPVKHQFKTARKPGVKSKSKKPSSGYNIYAEEVRPHVIKLLIEKPDERVFLGKDGEEEEIDSKDFTKGSPTFTHITKKTASMWRTLTEQERNEYIKKSKEMKIKEKEHNSEVLSSLKVQKEKVKDESDKDGSIPKKGGAKRVQNKSAK